MSSHSDPSAPLQGGPTKSTERKLKRESRTQLVAFVLMIFMTSLAFVSIGSDAIPNGFAIPFILMLAGIQVVLQLYFFMHMNEKGTAWINIMIWSGMFVAALTVGALMFLLGIVKY
ncbi:cytochrome C oxidase subunit IV family protein [Salipaludibacillus sp. LMS25]|jgi:cytochrome c oxidase subunit 4|uniref:cytochrome C oxidase subunit IV family protein n=1 Tax=Salipaludibacillus sp. LMS25 TaxID=2924031 RepID=UPI0020D012CA|nr:cytochrome C oxidase subunit IV family protein [Salipaludibacillus sp. LMS25]UTR15217.1 cytochrome C oxidase subunit IV family protein [Salipaludibacillus sp. LMS25]